MNQSLANRPLYPIYALAMTIVAQTGAIALGIFVQRSFEQSALSLILCMFAAYFIAHIFKLSFPWRLTNALLPFVAVSFIFTSLNVPTWLISLFVVLLVLIYLPTFWTRIPYYPTSSAMYDIVLNELPNGKRLRFLDLGSGFGSLLFYLARKRPDIEFVGVEISPLALIVSILRQKLFGPTNLHFHYQDFWKMNFSEYEFIYAFLAPPPMAKVWEKVQDELSTGQVFMTNSFAVPEQPNKTIELPDSKQNSLQIFTF